MTSGHSGSLQNWSPKTANLALKLAVQKAAQHPAQQEEAASRKNKQYEMQVTAR